LDVHQYHLPLVLDKGRKSGGETSSGMMSRRYSQCPLLIPTRKKMAAARKRKIQLLCLASCDVMDHRLPHMMCDT